jgi:hypothetical protein
MVNISHFPTLSGANFWTTLPAKPRAAYAHVALNTATEFAERVMASSAAKIIAKIGPGKF